MPRFAYTGRAASGAVNGELDGADASAVAALLQSRGVTPLQITAQRGGATASAKGATGRPVGLLTHWVLSQAK